MKTTEELKKLDIKKLLEELESELQHLFKAKFEVSNGQSKNSHLIGTHTSQVARIKTIIREKEVFSEEKLEKAA